jgi:hypothetical protein
LLTVCFLRAVFFLAIGKVYQTFLSLRSKLPAAKDGLKMSTSLT